MPSDFAARGVPPGSRVVLAAGRFDAAADLKSAVWAFDVLKYTAPDWRLVVVGDGPGRAAVERFAWRVGFDDYRTHFAGRRADPPGLIRAAAVVWVTHRTGGTATAVAAGAAGVPVVGFDQPGLRAIGGVVLVPAGDPVALAAATYNLIPAPAPADSAVAGRPAGVYDAVPATLPAGA